MNTLAMTLLLAATFTPAEEMEQLLASLHGVDPAHSAIVCADPSALQVAQTWADPDRLLLTAPPLDRYKAHNAYLMLAEGCGPTGRVKAIDRLRDLRTVRDGSWKAFMNVVPTPKPQPDPKVAGWLKHAELCMRVETQALRSFGAAKDDGLLSDLLPRVQDDVELQLPMIAYFSAVAPGDPSVKQELTTLRKTTKRNAVVAAIDAWLQLAP